MVPAEQMAAYISAQVDALRYFSRRDRAAARPLGLRLGAEQHDRCPGRRLRGADRAAPRPARGRDPRLGQRRSIPRTTETGACGPGETLCARRSSRTRGTTRPGGRFRTWSQSTLAIGACCRQHWSQGSPSSLRQLSVAGRAARGRSQSRCARASAAGTFSTSSRAGPWTPTLTLTVAPGAVAMLLLPRHARRTARRCQASAPGTTQATRDVTIVAGPATRVTVTPASREIRARGEARVHGRSRRIRSGTPRPQASAGVSRAAALGRLVRTRQNAVDVSRPDASSGRRP